MTTAHDPTGPWLEHPRRAEFLDVHAKIAWLIIDGMRAELLASTHVRAQVLRVLNETSWAATEVVRSWKYRLRYVSVGVYELCKTHGPLDVWAREGGSPAVRHEHVIERRHLKHTLLQAGSLPAVRQVLEEAEGCVVSTEEHDRLSRQRASGWDRYYAAHIGIWDRKDQLWRTPATR